MQRHLEPSHVADLLIPVPDDWKVVRAVVRSAEAFFRSKETADEASEAMLIGLTEAVPEPQVETSAGEIVGSPVDTGPADPIR